MPAAPNTAITYANQCNISVVVLSHRTHLLCVVSSCCSWIPLAPSIGWYFSYICPTLHIRLHCHSTPQTFFALYGCAASVAVKTKYSGTACNPKVCMKLISCQKTPLYTSQNTLTTTIHSKREVYVQNLHTPCLCRV